jgi:thioredoxin reductase (NADPH)
MSNTQPIEVIIVGAGPIGIELAVALKRRALAFELLEAGSVGATIGWYAPGTTFFSSPENIAIAGYPLETPNQAKATREEYLQHLRGVLRAEEIPVSTNREVTAIVRCTDGYQVTVRSSSYGFGDPRRPKEVPLVGGQTIFHAKRVVLAIGDMHRPRRLGIPGEDLAHVSHYLSDPHTYFGRRVLIVGGKNSAVEAAIRLNRVGARVTISHRHPTLAASIKYWLRPELEGLIRRGAIKYLPNTTLTEITPTLVTLQDSTATLSTLEADWVLLLTGYEQDGSLFSKCGILLEGDSKRPCFDPHTMETNVPGIYIAGTAVAGSQKRHVEFIETAHIHVERIVRHICGEPPPQEESRKNIENLES